MQELIIVTGIILKQTPIGDYDRRICLLTKERGKIAAFVRGSRKPGSRLSSATNPFSFGVFKLHAGKDSYTVVEADIQNYFEDLRSDFVGAYYGMYFAEIVDYYTRENVDERQMMKLFYQSLRALCVPSISNELIQCIFEMKSIVINGEFPGINPKWNLSESAAYAISYIESSSIEKLYTFSVTDEVLLELKRAAEEYRKKIMDHTFKSLEILQTLG